MALGNEICRHRDRDRAHPPSRARGKLLVRGFRHKHRGTFDIAAKRRREIVLHARHIGAADTEDLPRWLIAWVWHNRKATDQIWSVMNAARNMGREITEAEASAITEEASITRKHLSADNLARFLGVTYQQRRALGLTTIGSVNVKKRARQELRKRANRLIQERKRRALGARPQSQSLSRTKPWRELGMSRAVWYRRNKARRKGETVSSPPIFLTYAEEVVSPERKGNSSGASPRKKKESLPSSQTATTMAADRLVSLPLELRLMALGLPMPDNLARAA
jgi:hypothetical protein